MLKTCIEKAVRGEKCTEKAKKRVLAPKERDRNDLVTKAIKLSRFKNGL